MASVYARVAKISNAVDRSNYLKDERFKSIAYHQFLHSENAEDLQYRLENEYNKYISNEESNEENKIEEQEEIEP